MEDIRTRYVSAIIHTNSRDNIVWIESTKLPYLLLKNGMNENLELDRLKDAEWGILGSSGHEHTLKEFKLDKIGDKSVVKAIIKDLKLSKETLVSRFERLARMTSFLNPKMQKNNLDLIKYFVKDNDNPKADFNTRVHNPKANYNEFLLTDNVFRHKETEEFVENVKKKLKKELKNTDGVLCKVYFDGISGPNFSNLWDHFKGLMFAINRLQAFSVEVTEYAFYREKKRFDVTIDFSLYDRFGMDIEDVEKFGTFFNIIKQEKLLKVLFGATVAAAAAALLWEGFALFANSGQQKEEGKTVAALAGAGAGAMASLESLLIPVAEGFRAWFILQHYFGCKPFITEMKKTITLKGVPL